MEKKKKVLWWGRFDPDYSRNRVCISLFRRLGWDVDFFFVKLWPRFGDVEAFFRGLQFREKPDLVWVPVARHRDMLAACRWAHRRGIPVIFDPLISAWDKKVLEQLKWKAHEPRARRLHALERKIMHSPDFVVWDTVCHIDFCEREYEVPRSKMSHLFIATDESVFKPRPAPERDDSSFNVLFYGSFLPLHGVEHIVEAARMTQGTGIRWILLGGRRHRAAIEMMARDVSNVTFLDPVPYEKLPEAISSADVVLGVFGTSEKASRVIANKVYEAMSCARPIVNEFCAGYPPEAKDCKSIKFVPPGDARAIADAVRAYRDDWSDRESYFAAAREFFERFLSMEVAERQLAGILDEVMSRATR